MTWGGTTWGTTAWATEGAGTRLYFRATEVPDISPAAHPSWTSSASMIRRVMATTKLAGDTVASSSVGGVGVGQKAAHYQFISEPMVPGLVFDEATMRFKCYAHAKESNTDDNCNAALAMQIVSADGSVVREKASPLDYSTGGAEFNQPALRAKSFGNGPASWNLDGTTYTTVAGDRLVIELGHGVFSGGVSATASIRRGSDETAADCPENETDTTGAVPWVELNLVLAFAAAPSTSVPTVPIIRRPTIVHAKIDRRSVPLMDWTADATVNWGYRTLVGMIPETVTWAEQESPVELWLSDETLLWAGKLSLDPQTDRGRRSIRAEGYAQDLAAATTRLFYRIDGGEQWVELDGDPHNFTANHKYDLFQGPNGLWYRWGNNSEAFSTGQESGFVLWVEGGLITRYEFLAETSISLASWDLDVRSFTGPQGSRTLIATHPLVSTSQDLASNLSVPEDGLMLALEANTDVPSVPRRQLKLTGIKVYGRTKDDAFSSSDVVADVGTTDGFDVSGVLSDSLAVLPLDWTSERSHPELLDYMAELRDWQWQALGAEDGVPRLAFGPYETTWTGYQADGLQPTWENQKRYNQVTVPFTYVSGRSGSRTAEPLVDPFPGKTVPYPAEPLVDPQPDGTLAAAAAAAQVEFRASKQVAGRVGVGRVSSMAGEPSSGYKVRPGHLLDVADRTDLDPQRIVGVTYRDHEDVVADVGRDFNVTRMLAKLQRDQGRQRRKRR